MELIRTYLLKGLVLSLLLGWVFAFLGVYDTSDQPMLKRYVFWTSTMLVGFLTTGICGPWIWHHVFPTRNRYIHLALISAAISFPVTLVLAAYDHNYGVDWSLYVWSMQYLYVIAISLILIFGCFFVLKAQGLIDAAAPDTVSKQDKGKDREAETRFLDRLSAPFQGSTLYAVSAEDHYLRVYTSVGETLILMRLSDALHALESLPGMQTHRSWWVARQAVVDIQRQDGKTKLVLVSGMTVPVSRTFDKQVRTAQLV